MTNYLHPVVVWLSIMAFFLCSDILYRWIVAFKTMLKGKKK